MPIAKSDRRIIIKKKNTRVVSNRKISTTSDVSTLDRLEQNIQSPSSKRVGGDVVYLGNDGPMNETLKKNCEISYSFRTWEEAKTHLGNKRLSFTVFTMMTEPVEGIYQSLVEIFERTNQSGTIFIPEYWNLPDKNPKKVAVNRILEKYEKNMVRSRQQTKPGINDSYLSIKVCNNPVFQERTKPLIVAMVLKTGSQYNREHVIKLSNMIKKNLSGNYEIWCLTNAYNDRYIKNHVDNLVPLSYNLKGWWSKIELFKPGLFGGKHVLYLDLDTLITGPIDYLARYGGKFLALRDFNTLTDMGSGIMSWDGDEWDHTFESMLKIAGSAKKNQYTGGDQQLIEEVIGMDNVEFFQDLFPGKLYEFKYKCMREDDSIVDPDEVRDGIICFHGKPKMQDLRNTKLIREYWG